MSNSPAQRLIEAIPVAVGQGDPPLVKALQDFARGCRSMVEDVRAGKRPKADALATVNAIEQSARQLDDSPIWPALESLFKRVRADLDEASTIELLRRLDCPLPEVEVVSTPEENARGEMRVHVVMPVRAVMADVGPFGVPLQHETAETFMRLLAGEGRVKATARAILGAPQPGDEDLVDEQLRRRVVSGEPIGQRWRNPTPIEREADEVARLLALARNPPREADPDVTVRQLIAALQALGPEALDMPACVEDECGTASADGRVEIRSMNGGRHVLIRTASGGCGD